MKMYDLLVQGSIIYKRKNLLWFILIKSSAVDLNIKCFYKKGFKQTRFLVVCTTGF